MFSTSFPIFRTKVLVISSSLLNSFTIFQHMLCRKRKDNKTQKLMWFILIYTNCFTLKDLTICMVIVRSENLNDFPQSIYSDLFLKKHKRNTGWTHEHVHERENLLVVQIKLQIFIIATLDHAGQVLKILHGLTIESKNLYTYKEQSLIDSSVLQNN